MLVACQTQKSATTDTVQNERNEESGSARQGTGVNPDDSRIAIKITKIDDLDIEGALLEVYERGSGFQDYLGTGDILSFKLLQSVDGLKVGSVLTGIITARGISPGNTYKLKSAKLVK